MNSNSFYLWIFEYYCDSDCGNYGVRNRQAEYGISSADMMNGYGEEALDDAKKYFENISLNTKNSLIENYRIHCISHIEHYQNELKKIEELKNERS